MKRRVVTAAPIRATVTDTIEAVGRCGAALFPEKVDIEDNKGLSVAEKVSVTLTRLAEPTWAVAWIPAGHSKWLPAFEGRLNVMRIKGNGTQLVLRGLYEPPFGWFGALGDHLAGNRLARRSVAQMAHRLAEQIDDEVRRHRDSEPTAVAPYPPDLRGDRHYEGRA